MVPWFGVVIVLFVGFLFGGLVAWHASRLRFERAAEQGRTEAATSMAALNERLAARDQELATLHQRQEKLDSDLISARSELATQQQAAVAAN